MKKEYKKPAVKVLVVRTDALMAASTVGFSDTPHEGAFDAKSNPVNAWEDNSSEDNNPWKE